MFAYGYEVQFDLLIAHLLLVYSNIHTMLLNHDWLMGYFYELWVLSPDQTDSQVDASSQLALTLVEIKFSCKSTQVFHRLATQPKSTQVG